MENEIMGYIFCAGMTVGLFVIIWLLSNLLSKMSDKMLPDMEEE